MKNTMRVTVIAALTLLSSCSQNESYHKDMAMENVAIASQTANSNVKAISTSQPAKTYEHLKIIKTANARFKVINLDSCTTKAQKLIHKWNGYVANMRYTQNDYQLENQMVFKVPAENFDKILKDLTQLAEYVDYKNITSEDITADYVDLTSRLATKKAVQAKYDQILRSKAKTVDEVLKTEEKLRVLQEEIEAAEGRLKLMVNQTSLSTIQVDFYQTVAYQKEQESYVMTFGDKASNSLGYGWGFIKSVVLIILTIWPLFILIPLVIFGLKWLKRKK